MPTRYLTHIHEFSRSRGGGSRKEEGGREVLHYSTTQCPFGWQNFELGDKANMAEEEKYYII